MNSFSTAFLWTAGIASRDGALSGVRVKLLEGSMFLSLWLLNIPPFGAALVHVLGLPTALYEAVQMILPASSILRKFPQFDRDKTASTGMAFKAGFESPPSAQYFSYDCHRLIGAR